MFSFPSIFLLVNSLTQPAAEVSNQISLVRDVAYTTPALNSFHKPLTMDVAFPNKGSKPLPVIMYIHGGGWDSGSKSEGEKFLALMAHGGYFTASIDFRGTGEGGFPETIIDINSAINFIVKYKDELNINPNLIGLVGYSSGGHLAVLTACSANNETMQNMLGQHTLNGSIKCVASINGAVVPKYLSRQYKLRALDWSGAKKEREMEFIFPATYLDENDPPVYLLSGKEDQVAPNRLARQFAGLLKRRDVKHTFQTIHKTGHLISEPSHYLDLLKFVDQQLQGNAYQILATQIQGESNSME